MLCQDWSHSLWKSLIVVVLKSVYMRVCKVSAAKGASCNMSDVIHSWPEGRSCLETDIHSLLQAG